MTYTLPIAFDSQREEARKWEMGIVARYVLPVYQDYYNLPGRLSAQCGRGFPRAGSRAFKRGISSSASANRPFWAI